MREWAEGREEEWRCFHCVFYDLSLTAPIVAGQGEKEKGPQLRRAAFRINQSPPQLPSTLIDASAAKRTGCTPLTFVMFQLAQLWVDSSLNRHKLGEEEDEQRASGPERRDHDRWI